MQKSLMVSAIAIMCLFFWPLSVFSLDIPLSVSWVAPQTNADGTDLTDLSHYTIYACDQSVPTNDPNGDGNPEVEISCPGIMQTYTAQSDKTQIDFLYVTEKQEGTVYLRATASDTSGNESLVSDQETYHFDFLPPAKISITIIINVQQ